MTGINDTDPGDTRQGNLIERRRSSASRSGLYRPALIASGIGLLLSLVGAYAVGQWEERVTKVEFEGVAETQAIVMQNGINEYISRLAALRTLFESANEEITRSEFETFSRPPVRAAPWHPSCCLAPEGQSEGARGIRSCRDRRWSFRLSDQIARSGRQHCGGSAERRILSCLLFHSTENLSRLRDGLCERPRPAGHAGTRPRQR